MNEAARTPNIRNLLSICLMLVVGYSVYAGRLKGYIRLHSRQAVAVADSLLVVACVLIAAGLLGGYNTWQQNRSLRIQAARAVAGANHHTKQTNNKASVLAPGKMPSTTPPPTAAYQVAPNLPQLLIIPKINVTARVLAVGLNADHSLATPSNIFDTAWYNGSSLPGDPGAMLIDGHISSWTSPGVFYHLAYLQSGDAITVERGNGSVVTYHVVKVQIYNAANINMSQVLAPINPERPGLNLISCYGSVIRGTNSFSERVVVFASE